MSSSLQRLVAHATCSFALLVLTGVGLCSTLDDRVGNSGQLCPGERRVAVLGGGGIRGAYQVGALWYLIEIAGCEFHRYVGTSTGAVTAAVLAQADALPALRKRVARLVSIYNDLSSDTDLREARPFGTLRLLLPRWLGGVDGLYRLRPLEERLRRDFVAQVPSARRISITGTSLQSGEFVDPYFRDRRPISLLDSVLGSASIPIGVEPRLIRAWEDGRLLSAEWHEEPGTIVVATSLMPGAPDPNCTVQIGDDLLVCEDRGTKVRPWPGCARFPILKDCIPEYLTTLHLPSLIDARKWQHFVAKIDAELSQKAPLAPRKSMFQRGKIEFTALHQIVDGGVLHSTPIDYAFGALEGPETYFVFGTGRNIPKPESRALLHGFFSIAARSLDLLWERYSLLQSHEIMENLRALRAHREKLGILATATDSWINRATAWRDVIVREVGEDAIRAIEVKHGISFPKTAEHPLLQLSGSLVEGRPTPGVIEIEPSETHFTETFDVRRSAIAKALIHGCEAAARRLAEIRGQQRELDLRPCATLPQIRMSHP